jgi:hypothetical protein
MRALPGAPTTHRPTSEVSNETLKQWAADPQTKPSNQEARRAGVKLPLTTEAKWESGNNR